MTDRTEYPYLISSTGMLHQQGCQQLRVTVSRVKVVTPEAAAEVTSRCQVCQPRPLGQAFTPGERLTAPERADRDAKARQARQAQAAAERAAQHTPELDAAIAAFIENECQATYDAMSALTPEGYNPFSRARELGLEIAR